MCSLWGNTINFSIVLSGTAQCTACSRPGNMSCRRAVDEPWGKALNENKVRQLCMKIPQWNSSLKNNNEEQQQKNISAPRRVPWLLLVWIDLMGQETIHTYHFKWRNKIWKDSTLRRQESSLGSVSFVNYVLGRSVCIRKPQFDSSVLLVAAVKGREFG